ncbi:RHS repeat protein [Colwellia sp. M166]|uniref:DUF6531 domain-containing protein n=1 Tax=Colwellia sp. M166 TaxID=2583805 RepID=UPI00211E5974|nr:DUF6531 domain-containing protein [Colwellia sp. M166]UUO22966.1 RHS repeat protein [Colwellia sp. M166]
MKAIKKLLLINFSLLLLVTPLRSEANTWIAWDYIYGSGAQATAGSALQACKDVDPGLDPEEVSLEQQGDNYYCSQGGGPFAAVCRQVDWYTNTPEELEIISEGDVLDLTFSSSSRVTGDCGRPGLKVDNINEQVLDIISGADSDYGSYAHLTSPTILKMQTPQNNYFSGNREEQLEYIGESGSPGWENILSNYNTTVVIEDDEEIPILSFSGSTEVLEGESFELTLSLNIATDTGFVIRYNLNDATHLTEEGVSISGVGSFTSTIDASLYSNKVDLPRQFLTGNSEDNEKFSGDKQIIITAELVKNGVSYSSTQHSFIILEDDPVELEEELGYECPMTEHPVNIRSGNKYLRHVDAEFYNFGRSYQIVRHYNSFTNEWSFEFEKHLKFDVDKIKVVQGDGKIISFTDNAGVYIPDIATRVELTNVGGFYFVNLSGASIEKYDSFGKLLSKTHRDGSSLNYTYEPLKNSILDSESNLLYVASFDINGNVSTISTSDGETITYQYISDNLTSVTNTNGQSKTYIYSTQGLTQAVENGYVINNITYDSKGRVTQSKVGNSGDFETFNYGSLQTTVTNSLGKETIYNYININDRFKISSVDGVASTNCVSSNTSYGYNTKGFLMSQTDSRGIITTYQRDSEGWEVGRTEASGTANERTTSTLWDKTLGLPLTITTPKTTVNYTYDSKGMVLKKEIVPTNIQF